MHSAPAAIDVNDKCSDPASGLVIMLSRRMSTKTRLKGPVCNLFYIVVYIPQKGRTVAPKTDDTIAQLAGLLQTVRKSECVIIGGDFNCQLQRSVPGCTGKCCMTKHENKGHGGKVLDLLWTYDLCVIGTYFKSKRKKWAGRYRHCNATYLSKDNTRRPTKLDYLCVSNRWKSMVINTETKWSPSIHRFGHKFDHALVSATWRWRTKKTEQIGRPDYEAMDEQRWTAFDCDLRIRMERSKQKRYEASQSAVCKTREDTPNDKLQVEYAHLTNIVRESIDAMVSSKTRTKKKRQNCIRCNKDTLRSKNKTIPSKQVKSSRSQKMEQENKSLM